MTDSTINLIKVYCEGVPGSPHKRHKERYIARMVRTLRVDGTTGWAVARDGGRQHAADDWDHNRFDLRCRCGVNAPVVVDQTRATRAYELLVRELDDVAAEGESKLKLYALAVLLSNSTAGKRR